MPQDRETLVVQSSVKKRFKNHEELAPVLDRLPSSLKTVAAEPALIAGDDPRKSSQFEKEADCKLQNVQCK